MTEAVFYPVPTTPHYTGLLYETTFDEYTTFPVHSIGHSSEQKRCAPSMWNITSG
ncbi:MAG: hypothetical protein MPW15_19235 [Candidatus Manganitrophus sp.]|nr:hypothetical protein [Candidatus Manganitrophus sp.]